MNNQSNKNDDQLPTINWNRPYAWVRPPFTSKPSECEQLYSIMMPNNLLCVLIRVKDTGEYQLVEQSTGRRIVNPNNVEFCTDGSGVVNVSNNRWIVIWLETRYAGGPYVKRTNEHFYEIGEAAHFVKMKKMDDDFFKCLGYYNITTDEFVPDPKDDD